MIKAEFENIAKHKLLTATICAIMIIPFLYSVFFLKSVWDPYGNTGHLPVAVVNKDQSVRFQGKNFAVGDQLVDKLKENEDLDWHFVSAKKARYGLGHKKYYMVITIPENFSKNATTVLNKKPKKMELTYKTNDSLNYIGAVISKQGATKVDASVKESVSEAYADTMFKVIKKVGGGFKTAANGAKKLSDGSKTLSDGLNTYTAGVDTVNKGVMTLNAGVVPLGSGVLQLTTGSSTLKNGIDTYTAGVDKVNGGVQTLKGSVPALTSGVGQLYTGSNALKNGVANYTKGTDQVADGIAQFNSNVPELTAGATKLVSGTGNLKNGVSDYTKGASQIKDGLTQLDLNSATLNKSVAGLSELPQGVAATYILNSTINAGLKQIDTNELDSMVSSMADVQSKKEQIAKLSGTLATIKANIGTLNTELATAKTGIATVNNAKTEFNKAMTQYLTEIATNSLKSNASATTAQADIDKVLNSGTLSEDQKNALNDAKTQISAIQTNNKDTLQAVNNLKAAAQTFNTTTEKVLSGLNNLMSSVDKLKGGLASVDGTIDTANKLLAESDDLTNAESQAKVKKLSAAVKSLQSLSANAVQISTAVNSGVNTEEALKDLDLNAIFAASADEAKVQQLIASQSAKMAMHSQIPALIKGVGNYTAGVSQALAGSNELVANNNKLNAGATELANGVDGLGKKIPELTQGITALYNGTQKLKNNSAVLNSGASQINAGLGQLNGKVPALASGVNQLASGTSQLAANSGALRSGSGQLASGLGQLNSQVPTLTDGVSQLAAGTSKLAANSGKLDKGATDVHKGNKKLASALKGGADTVTKLKLGSANASMFASPTKLKEKHYSYVPNYGYALAPYMLSVALFVGCLVFNLVYPIHRISTEDGSATEWFFSKVAIGSLVATGNALVETLLMMAFGLHPNHPVQMIVNAVSFSFTAMFLIMFMSMAFGNPGRFISMILLVIQLGSCGGSFPIEITRGMNGFFQAINPYLPMTYSVYGFREALTSGLGENQVLHSVLIQLIFIAAFLILLYVTMRIIRPEQEFHEEMESEYPGN
ncbi:YhgE/Pip domain-containing protein [Ligilactobacillus ruminis]|uniref:YhgE/Pip domain-containing protein n=1 Tax=Ligilactobacillus ruminis TaxID=1623 RepID=UPI0023604DEA|nr:YhgE/Pip domain-containing protein [Ligilactobacillus ruminis]WDC81113.1 YhgE/Pip domain-containing protein [Ligilactobacillus ruminis]